MANQIHITGLYRMPDYVRELGPSHLISIIQPEFQPSQPLEIAPARHLRVAVHDVTYDDGFSVVPKAVDIERVIDFLEEWNPEQGSLLVHCYAGVSRSTAVALIAHFLKTGDPDASAQELRRAAPHAAPNSRILVLADEALGLEGALILASEKMGEPSWLAEETLATLSL